MDLELREYDRKTFRVTAVRITEENIQKAAKWSGATLITDPTLHNGKPHIRVPVGVKAGKKVFGPAFVGDWLTEHEGYFQRYRNEKFPSVFKLYEETENEALRRKEMQKVIKDFLDGLMAVHEDYTVALMDRHIDAAADKALLL